MRMTRRGATLIELLAALAITGLLGAATVRLLDRTQRFTRGTALLAEQQAQLAAASHALLGALASTSPADGDLLGGSDSSVAYLGSVGVALACAHAATSVDLAATTLSSGATLTWWNTAPQPGDSLTILDEGASIDASDDRWFHTAVTAIATRLGACLATPFLDPVLDVASVGWRLTLSDSLPPTVASVAPARVLRPERFALYRSGTEWMLGWTEWNPAGGGWNAIQPVAGPLLPPAPWPATSGITLRWMDAAGVAQAATPTAPVRSGDFWLGATMRQQLRVDGMVRGFRRDSLRSRLPLRNAP